MSSTVSAPDPSAHRTWLNDFFSVIDRMDAPAFAAFFDPSQGSFRFANQPALVGQEPIEQGCAGIFGLLQSIRHEILTHWVADGDLLVEGRVHYRRQDGFELSVPFLSVFEFADRSPGPIRSYRVFVDSHELFQTPSA